MSHTATARSVIDTEITALQQMATRLSADPHDSFNRAVATILAMQGNVVGVLQIFDLDVH